MSNKKKKNDETAFNWRINYTDSKKGNEIIIETRYDIITVNDLINIKIPKI